MLGLLKKDPTEETRRFRANFKNLTLSEGAIHSLEP